MDKQTKLSLEKGELLPLMEAFYSIQGEGVHTGSAAYFLRIGGCDVGCHWCDVKESWDFESHPLTLIDDIIVDIKNSPTETIVITGGEPLMWNLNKLTKRLHQSNYNIHLETSGAYPLTGSFDWVCLSPKKQQNALKEVRSITNEFKVIVYNKHDLKWAKEQAIGLPIDCDLYLQPEWTKRDEIMPLIIDFIKQNKQWKISLQSHKYMNVP